MVMTRKWFNPDGSRMTCTVGDCGEEIRNSGMCKKHYQHFYYMSTNGIGRKRYTTKGGTN